MTRRMRTVGGDYIDIGKLSLADLVKMRNELASNPANLGHPKSQRIYTPRVTLMLWQIRRVIKQKMTAIALSRGEVIDFADYTGIDIPMTKSQIPNCESA